MAKLILARKLKIFQNLEESLSVNGVLSQTEINGLSNTEKANKSFFVTTASSERVVEFNSNGTASQLKKDRTENFFFSNDSVTPSLLYFWNAGTEKYSLIDEFTYHPSLTYKIGDIRLDPSTGIRYKSLKDNNKGNALTDTTSWEKEEASSTTPVFLDTTDGQKLLWEKHYILHPTFNYTFPKVTETGGTNWIQAIPSQADWTKFTGTWAGDGTDTIANGQAGGISATNNTLRFTGVLSTTSNIIISVGEGEPSESYETYQLRSGLPDPTTVKTGTIAIVANDPAPNLNGVVTAIGVIGENASGWSS